MIRVLIAALTTISLVAGVASPALAHWDDGWWYLDFSSTSAPARPLLVGVDEGEGGGFGFVTYLDDDNDGTIRGPRVPVGGRLAMGVVQANGDVDCDIYDLIGSGVVGQVIVVPLLTNATEGESVGIDFGELMAPPRAFTSGERFSVANGELPVWPALRFVDESGITDLESFVRDVDTLPAFNGDVVVSDARLSFTFVPEPSSLLLVTLAAAGMSLATRWRVCRSQEFIDT